MLRKVKLTIAYDGTDYHGWQIQPGMKTIQAALFDAFEKLTCRPADITGASRTDAGVHAIGQSVSVTIDTPVPTENFVKALNDFLPDDIAVYEAVDVPNDFDVMGGVTSKIYRYGIYTCQIRDVMSNRMFFHRPGPLEIDKMRKAAEYIVGKKDFRAFASAADTRTSSVRTVMKCDISTDGPRIYFDVEGDGFLYNMVRNIVGTLIEVGRGRWEPEYIKDIIAAQDRKAAGPIAPAKGLCLMKIFYKNNND